VTAEPAGAEVVEQLMTWAAEGDPPLMFLAGLTAAGRAEVISRALRGWTGLGLTVLVGRTPMTPGDVLTAALYDAVIRSPRWSGPGEAGRDAVPDLPVPASAPPGEAVAGWANLVRIAAGPRPFLLVLHEVDVGADGTRTALRALAANLRAGVPAGRVVVNPLEDVPDLAGESGDPVLVCPASTIPDRLVEPGGVERRLHPGLAERLRSVSADRHVMLDVLRAWHRQARLRLVDGLWLPGDDLPVPALALTRPALGRLRPLPQEQFAVMAAVAVLGPVRRGELDAALVDPWPVGADPVGACLRGLRERGLVVHRDGEFVVVDDVIRASLAASVGAATQGLWRSRTGRGELVVSGSEDRPGAVPRPGADLDPAGIPGDGEAAIEAARWAVAMPGGRGPALPAAIAAGVLARRGRLDRARTWLELARSEPESEPGADVAAAADAVGWAQGQIGRLEGRAGADFSSPGPAGAESLRGPGVDERVLRSPDLDYVSALRLASGVIDAVAAGSAGPERLRDVLTVTRQRRAVLEWCRAARLARSARIAAGSPPRGPDGVDDVQRALLSLTAAGLSTRDCAAALSLHVRAVEYRIRALFELSGTTSRAQLVRAYVDGRVVDPAL
jgi:DNA-binding CsgD family transcriptional regulator